MPGNVAEENDHGTHEDVKKPQVVRALGWVASFAIPGLGMFCEAYFIFSIGNVRVVWEEEYPDCWRANQGGCSQAFLNSLSYTQVSGLIAGMVALAATVDHLGRKKGAIFTAAVMFISGILLTASTGPTPQALFIMLLVAQTLFGFGCGGEFPVAAASASERAEASEELRAKRGQTVVLVFAMQSWGNLLNIAVLVIFLHALGQNAPPYRSSALGLTWRMSYGLGLIPIAYMLYHRIFRLRESEVWKAHRAEQKGAKASNGENGTADPAAKEHTRGRVFRLLLRHYWSRLAGASLGWFAWDFYYYGNKLFQDKFIRVLHPDVTLLGLLEYSMLNSSVALFGYYFAAFTIDRPWMGRRRMQLMGFGWLFALFLACGLAFNSLLASPSGLRTLQALYYLTSFWGQFGPNATTFLIAGEIFPTEARGMAHGIAAAIGKLGALSADIIMAKVSNRNLFFLSAAAGGMGVLVTQIFVPEVMQLDLRDGDARWAALIAADAGERQYTGEAVNPRNLSWLERMMGLGRPYKQHHAPPPEEPVAPQEVELTSS